MCGNIPASVLSFSDIAFSVCSSFRHGIDLLCNGKPYRKQHRKATKKRNRYQKIIICPSEPRRLIFDYCGAIFALPEAFFFGYSGAIFEWLKVSFHCLQRRKIYTFSSENRRCSKSTFLSG